MPANSISPRPRAAPGHLLGGVGGQQVGFGTAQQQDRAADLVPEVPHQDAAQAPGAVGLGDAGVMVAQEAAIAVGAHAVLGEVAPVVVVQRAERRQRGADIVLGLGEIGKPRRRGIEVDAKAAQGRARDVRARCR